MIKNKLKINDSKTEFLVLRSSFFKQQFNDLQINVGNTEINPSLSARNLGVIFDSHLNLESHIKSVCRSAYFHLRNIRNIRNMLTDNACSQLIHALVTVRIDYCNSLLYGLPDCSLSRLQRILNTAARILCKIPKFDHITKTLLDLHWLPTQQRIRFKILILTQQTFSDEMESSRFRICVIVRIVTASYERDIGVFTIQNWRHWWHLDNADFRHR